MKFLFITSRRNQELKTVIKNRLRIRTKIDLYSHSGSYSEMISIFDSSKNEISYYNKVSKEKVSQYPAIRPDNIDECNLVALILSNIIGNISLIANKTSYGIEISGISKEKNNSIEELIKDSSIDNPASVHLHIDKFLRSDLSFLFSKNEDKAINLKYFDVIFEGKTIYDVMQSRYSVVDIEGMFGCSAADFIKEMSTLDISNSVINVVKSGRYSSGDKLSKFIIEGRAKVIAIRNGNESISVSMEDFLSASDCSDALLINMLNALPKIGTIAEDNEEEDYDDDDDEYHDEEKKPEIAVTERFSSDISIDGKYMFDGIITDFSEIIKFKKYKFDLYNGTNC